MNNLKNKETIQSLTDTVKTIAACSNDIQKAAKDITLSCNIHGSNGEAHKKQLLAKAGDLKKLSALYNSAGRQLMSAARKLTDGASEEDVLPDLLVYGQFLTDQLRSEEEGARHILDMLRKEGSGHTR